MVSIPVAKVVVPENGLELAVMKALSGTSFTMTVELKQTRDGRQVEVIVFKSAENVVIEKENQSEND